MDESNPVVAMSADHQANRVAVEVHVRRTIDRIVDLAPRMADNIDVLMKGYGTHINEEG